MKDMFNMMGKMKEMEERLRNAQENLGQIVTEAEAGAGMVKVKANGKKQIVGLEVDPDLVKPEDREMLQDLIVAAVNKALEKAEEESKAYLQSQTADILPNIPGFDLSKFGG